VRCSGFVKVREGPRGVREIWGIFFFFFFFFERCSKDANQIKDNEEITLMDWGNAIIKTITRDGMLLIPNSCHPSNAEWERRLIL
jgi:hypothetical protein